MTKTKIRLAAAFSSLAIVGIGLIGYQSHGTINLLKTANTSALTAKQSAKATGQAVNSGPAIKNQTAVTPSAAPAPATSTVTQKATSKPAAAASTPPHPVVSVDAAPATASLYANPTSDIALNARAWAAANPGDASSMNRLASTPTAAWFGDFSGNIQTAVNNYVTAAANAGAVPQLVAYNIPERDCGSYSAGGATSAGAYQAWINSFAAGIGNRQAIVIVEPDALAGMDCLSAADQTSRLQLLSYAVDSLQTKTRAAIYLDAGNPGWQSATAMASRLKAADIAEATGFSLNVSNFETTSANVSYGNSLSALVGGKHYVIDTSRNGNGPASGSLAWCNPDDRAFGQTPSLQTGHSLIDAYLWVKGPGESDGSCGPEQSGTAAPAAGAWWPQYALMLAANSGW